MLDEIRDISRKKLKLFLGTIRKPTTIKIKLNNKNIFFMTNIVLNLKFIDHQKTLGKDSFQIFWKIIHFEFDREIQF